MQALYLLFLLLLLLILVLLLLVLLLFHLILLTYKAQQTSSQRTRKMWRVSPARILVLKEKSAKREMITKQTGRRQRRASRLHPHPEERETHRAAQPAEKNASASENAR